MALCEYFPSLMPSPYLQDLLGMLPENLPKPTEEHLALLQEVDESIQDGQDVVYQESTRIRKALRAYIHPQTFKRAIFSSVPRPGHMERSDPHFPTVVSEDIIAEHRRRIALVSSLFAQERFSHLTWEDGGTKSRKRLEQKIAAKTKPERPHPVITDMSRIRVVVPELPIMVRNITRTAESLYSDTSKLRVVEIIDWFYQTTLSKYDTPLRCANVIFQPYKPQNTPATLCTEIQFVTRRMRAGMDLNHPFDVTKQLAYPSEEHKAWMRTVIMKAALLDYRSQLHAFDLYSEGAATRFYDLMRECDTL